MYKNLFIIFLCQALVQCGNILLASTNTLIGLDITGSETLSTIPNAINTIAALVLTIPASFYMARFGRKSGFILGIFFALVGLTLIILGIMEKSFLIYCIGVALVGFQTSFATYFRFAAAELVHRDYKSRAVSIVLASGVLAAIIGPNLYKWGLSIWKELHFLGGFILLFPIYVLALFTILFLNTGKQTTLNWEKSKSLKDLFLHTPILKIIGIGSISYIVMVLIMTATPLGMKHHHFDMADITQIIQFHVLGMFVPSFFTGSLIKKFGDRQVMLFGCFLFLLCIVINFIDHTFLHFAYALILLGIGWNFLYVGATTLLSYQISADDQPKAQAVNDFIVTGFSALSIATSGKLHEIIGWVNVNLIAIPIILLGIFIIIRK